FVNACFARLMDEAVGELKYGERERLQAGREEGESQLNPICVEVQWLPRQTSPEATGNGYAENDDRESKTDETSGIKEGEALEQLAGIDAQAAWVAARIRELIAPASGLKIPDE